MDDTKRYDDETFVELWELQDQRMVERSVERMTAQD